MNPALVGTAAAPPAFTAARERVAALKPTYYRLMVDWRRLQPTAGGPPNWDSPSDGCIRGQPPCVESAGIRAILRALRERQQADGGWQIVVTFYGTPDWALRGGVPGCGTDRRPNLDAYRTLVRSFRELVAQEGVEVHLWSPWNEPNHPEFLGPQRASCSAEAEPLTPTEYANIAYAMQAELGAGDRLVLGELAGYDRKRARAVAAPEFAAALPAPLVCASDIWAQHAYVRPADVATGQAGEDEPSLAGDPDAAGDPSLLRDVIAALDAKGCERKHRLWITETGVGGPRTGENRPSDDETDRQSCEAMDNALRYWAQDTRVDAAFQYTFREDSSFPVGLADTALDRLYRSYEAWQAWSTPGAPPDTVGCRQAPPLDSP
ncbi:MAG: hypothetical protein QOG77_1450 [Solirubrobacteraceae bacterium]|jgi:hypothetical protein|nr:hypothetical protein [Solirubrobacteraceae bacterium]